MRVYLQLTVLDLLPVLCSACFYQAERKTAFGRLPYGVKQDVCGLVFGLVAVCNTEFGAPIDGAVVNVRDAAPLCAGLLFGAPAGILAGFIGGGGRHFSPFCGGGAASPSCPFFRPCCRGVFLASMWEISLLN